MGKKDPRQILLLKGIKGTSKEEAFKTIRQKQPKKFDVDSLADIPCPPCPGQNSWTHVVMIGRYYTEWVKSKRQSDQKQFS